MSTELTAKKEMFIHLIQINWLDGIDHGWGNGYVNLPKWHKYYGVHYDNIPVDVHGGLTYSEQEGDYWVVGFDTCHAWDTMEKWPKEKVLEEAIQLMNQLKKFRRKSTRIK